MSQEEVIRDFDAHIKKSNRQYYSDFYVGITNDINRRLFEEHNVSRENSWWIYSPCDDEKTARKVEKHYLDMGMQGDTGGGTGKNDAKYVYCYLVTSYTVEKKNEKK